jgi:hypothetical protein
MNKRSAMVVAAGLIVALVAGAYALALGVTGPAQSASAKTSPQAQTRTKTVWIHKNAPSAGGAIAMSAPLGGRSFSSNVTGGTSGTYTSPSGKKVHVTNTGGGNGDNGGSDDGGHTSSQPPTTTHSTPPPTSHSPWPSHSPHPTCTPSPGHPCDD